MCYNDSLALNHEAFSPPRNFRFSYYKKGRREKGAEEGLKQAIEFYKTWDFLN